MTTDNTFQYDTPTNSVEALRRAIANRLVYQVGKDLRSATQRDWLFARQVLTPLRVPWGLVV